MTTLADITLMMAELTKHVRRGVATGGSTTTLVDTNHPSRPDDFYNNQPQGTIWFLSGSLSGKSAMITDWVNNTKTFTFAAQTAAVQANTQYAALPGYISREAMIAAVNLAMKDYGPVDATTDITAESNTGSYALTGVIPGSISKVEILASGASTGTPHFWWTQFNDKLFFDNNPPSSGDTIRIYYQGRPSNVANDTDVINGKYDLTRLSWLAIWYACVPKTQEGENTDPTIRELAGIAQAKIGEFYARRPGRTPAKHPHLSNY